MHTPSPPHRPCPEQPPAPHLNDSAAQRSAVQGCSAAGGALVQALRGAGALVRPLTSTQDTVRFCVALAPAKVGRLNWMELFHRILSALETF